MKEFLSEETWTGILAYSADKFSRLNNLNSSPRGDCIKIFALRNKNDAFKKKWKL